MKKIIITGGNGFIGTNFCLALRERFNKQNIDVYIIDIAPPKITLDENEHWINLDILKKQELRDAFLNIKPDFVVHLAAETDCHPSLTIADYAVNTQGSLNVFDSCEASRIEFLVNTSTQFVNQSGSFPTHETDYAPHTAYGESKIVAEKYLREKGYTFNWVIIRPTNIWGRWHLRYPKEFWRILKEGKYFHPGSKEVKRSYGYVGNVCDQVLKLMEFRENMEVSKRVFYVGDEPVDLFDWVNSFSISIAKKPARVVPRPLVFLAALTGSLLQKAHVKFPITLSRYRSMTSDNPAPMEKTFAIIGKPRYTMQEGVDITTAWLFRYWNEN